MYQYFCSLWDSVKSFKELNISSQKESLTNNLCENYYEKSLETFRLSQNDLIGADIDNFAKIGGQIVSKAMGSFDEKAFPSGFRTANNKNKSNTVMENGEEIDYIDQIRYKWRKKLLGAIALQVKEIQKSKIDQLLVQLTERYKNELEKEMTEKNKTINDFGKKREETLVATKRAFAEGVLKLSIKEYVEVQLDKTIVEKIMNEMVRKVDLFCFEVLSRLFEDSLIRMTKEKLYLIRKTIRGGKQKMWGTIHEQRTDLHKNANFHIARFEKIWPDNKDFCSKWDNFRNNIQKRVLEEVVDELVRQSDFIYQILNER
ncbi:hypothetical protein MHBO_003012 [Bonamia ostreae]|uniref:Uncharacterized protein n=1 Tax=Bonamia ostreae TaxID=126728 RepID=A0ABV2AP74_9EUKA